LGQEITSRKVVAMLRSISLLIVLLVLNIPTGSFAQTKNCGMTPGEEAKLLSMTYEKFDQSKAGWRQYVKKDCYWEAGVLIDKYLVKNKSTLNDWQIISITWHAGQMYAFNNNYEIAESRFNASINPNETENTPILWNDYVYATIAFLNNDMTKLKYYREKIANGPSFKGKKVNLDVVDNLIRSFGKPYSVAYHSTD
jgi:hypothetical protein